MFIIKNNILFLKKLKIEFHILFINYLFIIMDFYKVLMFCGSIFLSIQLIPQNFKIYQNKNATTISYATIFLTLIGISTIITYGIHFHLMEMKSAVQTAFLHYDYYMLLG